MGFDVAADGYDRFIGRYSSKLAPLFADFAGVVAGPALDVGCGPGALTVELAARVGADKVAGVDLSEQFVAACRARIPGADIRLASAETLPFATGAFDSALSQLVVSFVPNPEQMASEMHRVVRGGGTVAFCTFEANGFAMVRAFWDAALGFDPGAPDDARMPFRRSSELVELCERAGLRHVFAAELLVEASYSDFDDLWSPFSFGIGPAAEYLRAQAPLRRAAIREACFDSLGRPTAAFVLPAKVLAVRGRAADCTILNDVHKGRANANGTCVVTDADGDKIFVEWKCAGVMPACPGTERFVGGTGKYTGISGNQKFQGNFIGDAGAGWSDWKGEYKLT